LPVVPVIPRDEAIHAVQQRFVIERIRNAVRWPVRMELDRELFDYGNEVAYALTSWVARLSEQATLRVSYPATWWQHLKLATYQRWPWVTRWISARWPPRMTVETHEASHYLPGVELPPNKREGEFYLWRLDKRESGE
jgi:hypothetical protein